ncbi:hypothetical protein SCLCIDRAFT_1223816 [Scleroderma citrinum Foug A]|uniref:Uncharacterized protein n=1 Tax=Scleroderma citrinum Foug A TaxID=1036808 RepID=A0A0C3D8D5_9AGAM|nr:hypothetical protein SCLCIDRAFT_1223816 [Scleroderma citrinum Foug A]
MPAHVPSIEPVRDLFDALKPPIPPGCHELHPRILYKAKPKSAEMRHSFSTSDRSLAQGRPEVDYVIRIPSLPEP